MLSLHESIEMIQNSLIGDCRIIFQKIKISKFLGKSCRLLLLNLLFLFLQLIFQNLQYLTWQGKFSYKLRFTTDRSTSKIKKHVRIIKTIRKSLQKEE